MDDGQGDAPDTGGGPARYHHGGLRAALLAAADRMLEETGPEALSLRELARRAGVSPRAPYRHYPDKEALLSELAAAGFRELAARLGDAEADAPARDAYHTPWPVQIAAYVRFALDRPARFRLMFGPRRAAPDAALAQAKAAAFAILARRVAQDAGLEARPCTDLQARAVGCWSLVHGLTILVLDGRVADQIDGTLDEVVARVSAAMGLGGPPPAAGG